MDRVGEGGTWVSVELVKLGDGEPGVREGEYGDGASRDERPTARGTFSGER